MGAETGCIIFDNATLKQKVFLLNYSLTHLLSRKIQAPDPTHILEAASYWPFAFMSENWISHEIENQNEEKKGKNTFYEDLYYYRTKWRRRFLDIYNSNILSQNIAVNIFLSSESEFNSLEECKEYFKKRLQFNCESIDMIEWKKIINQVSHNLILGDGEYFRMTSLTPPLLDGVTLNEKSTDFPKTYFTNKLPFVTDQEYEEAIENIFSYKEYYL